jgi:phage anti-repressor protein
MEPATQQHQELNIVELIEKNPITRLSHEYNGRLLTKIQESFTGFEQQLFVSSFYCYLNYDKNMDFVVDLDNVWNWLGFQQKYNAIRMIEKYFKIDIDYKNIEHQEAPKSHGGHNKQTIMLTVRCFKSLCLKAQTKKASEIHEYYMKMEEVLHQIVDEETDELKQQLEQKNAVIMEKDSVIQSTKKEKQRAVEQAIIGQFPLNTECIYFGTIDNTNADNEKLIKFGHTNDLSTRVMDHRKKYQNFVLVAAFRVQNKVEIENLIKTYPKIKRNIRSIEVGGKNKTEIIAYDSTYFTIERLKKHIADIIHSRTYSIDNFNRLMQRNEVLEAENIDLTKRLVKQEQELNELRELTTKQKQELEVVAAGHQSVYENVLLPEDELTQKFNEFIKVACIVRPDVEESSVSMEGRFRLWCQTKPTKETFHALKNYLDVRFKAKRIRGVHGYLGVKLKTVEYKKMPASEITSLSLSPNAETFLFERCQFSDCGKVLNSVLLKEYQKWKPSVGLPLAETDMKDLKAYLNASPHALKATVWTEQGNNEGYYGVSLREDYYALTNANNNNCNGKNPIVIATTGKKVEKREATTHQLLGSWPTIANAALSEGVCAAKMSRYVKAKTVISDYYYCIGERSSPNPSSGGHTSTA